MRKRLMVGLLIGGLMAVMTSGIAVAKTNPDKADCKQGGWEDLFDAEGNAFSSQGECVEYFAKVPDTCTELNKPKYDGTYHAKVVTVYSVGDEKITFYGDWTAVCPAEGFIGVDYRWTGGWGSTWGGNCELYDNGSRTTGALAGVGELKWEAQGNMGDPVWTVTCTHEY